ncbi:MAG: hypothetical protein AAGC68_02705 [Verrucomicrobiota bacterium]
MKLLPISFSLALAAVFTFPSRSEAQKKSKTRGNKSVETRSDYQLPPSPLPVGESGIMWYTTWDTALAEAQRSNRPLFFMAAAAECSGISGIF